MCYASAEGRSRDAREEEVLVVSRQPHGSNWLVSPDDMSTAVCLKEGTKVELLYIPEKTQRQFDCPREAEATFKMQEWWRRDLFVLRDGQKIPLKKLRPGQVVRVLVGPGILNRKEVYPEREPTEPVADQGILRHHMSELLRSSRPIGASD